MSTKKNKSQEKAEQKINGAVAAQACIFHYTRALYHQAAGRTEAAGQHTEAFQKMRDSLNGARRRVIEMTLPYLQAPTLGAEVTLFQDFQVPVRVEGVPISIDVSPELKEKLTAKAAQEGKSVRAMVREALAKLVA